MATNTVETKIVFSGDNTNLKKSIEEVTKQAKVMKQEFNVSDAADRATAAIHERAAIQSELIRRGVIEDPKLVEQRNKRTSARQSLALAGLSMSGMGGAAGGYGHGLAIGQGLDAMGFASLGRMAGPIGLAIGGAQQAAEAARKYERFSQNALYADKYLDPSTRARGGISALPFGETFLSYDDTFSGRTMGMQRNNDIKERMGITFGQQGRVSGMMADISRRRAGGAAEFEAMNSFQRGTPQSFDRTGIMGQVQTREAEALYNAKNRAAMADRELLKSTRDREALERNSVKLNEQRRKIGIDVKLGEESLVGHLKASGERMVSNIKTAAVMTALFPAFAPVFSGKAVTSGDDVGVHGARSQLDEFRKREKEIIAEQIKNGNDLKEATDRESRSKRSKAESDIDIKRAQLESLKGREELGLNQATRLGGMGPGGHAVGLAALDAINKIGIENAPPELISQAESIAPFRIAELKAAAGKNFAGGEIGDRLRNLGADQDANFARNLAGVTKQVDALGREIPKAQNQADIDLGGALNKGSDALQGIEKLLGEELPLLLQILDNKIRLLRNGLSQ